MIVTCERCATQFQLDDHKVPEQGARVRCSRCEHSFVVTSPARPDEDHAEELVRETLGATDELTDGDPFESDWEFNEDPVGSGAEADSDDDLQAARDAVDDLLAAAPRAPEASGLESAADDEPLDALGGPTLRDEPEPAIGPQEELGDPESWNLLDDDHDASTTYAGLPPAAETQTRIESPVEQPEIPAEPRFGVRVALEEPADEKPRWLAPAGRIAGWATLAVLVIAGVHGSLTADATESATTPGHWSEGGFEAREIAGRWLDNAAAGPVYVVSGQVRGRATSGPRRLEVRWLDAEGQPLEVDGIAVGAALPERTLRESAPAALQERQSRGAAQFASRPGMWSPFDAIAPELPDAAARFELVIVDR